MKVTGSTSGGAREVAREPAAAREPTRTPVTQSDLRAAIARALERDSGRKPSAGLVDTLTAHASLETGGGASMYDYNFGGIKGAAPDGGSALCRTTEVLSGKTVAVRDRFRAYRTLDDGALDYVRTMRSRFGAALEPAARGDAAGFAHALKRAGYYTASEADYTRGIERLMGKTPPAQATRTSPSHGASFGVAKSAPLTTAALSRVESSLDAGLLAGARMETHPRRAKETETEDD